jgi:hypothetical protein
MRSENENLEPDNTQRIYARLAGFLFLAEIILVLGSGFVLSHIEGSGTVAETTKRIATSEHSYRAALSTVVIVTLLSALLGFALYVTLRPVDRLLAQLGMIFWLGDSFLGLVVRMCSFVSLHLYMSARTTAVGAVTPDTLADLMHNIAGTTENIGGILFGIGSLLFFYLFSKSGYIPRVLSYLGLAASMIWTILYFANLIFPEHHRVFRYICLPLMAVTDVTTGFWLALFSIKHRVHRSSHSA